MHFIVRFPYLMLKNLTTSSSKKFWQNCTAKLFEKWWFYESIFTFLPIFQTTFTRGWVKNWFFFLFFWSFSKSPPFSTKIFLESQGSWHKSPYLICFLKKIFLKKLPWRLPPMQCKIKLHLQRGPYIPRTNSKKFTLKQR